LGFGLAVGLGVGRGVGFGVGLEVDPTVLVGVAVSVGPAVSVGVVEPNCGFDGAATAASLATAGVLGALASLGCPGATEPAGEPMMETPIKPTRTAATIVLFCRRDAARQANATLLTELSLFH
jgi:hypothetical protein